MKAPPAPWILPNRLRTACIALQCVPIPGVGAIIAGWKNPHSRLLRRGVAQSLLVIFGSWPLILPGAVGLGWAIYDAVRIATWSRPPGPWSQPTEESKVGDA